MDAHLPDVTLASLAARLDALERENARLHAEVAALKHSAISPSTTSKEDSADEPSNMSNERISRRGMLRKAVQATAATVVASALLRTDVHDASASHSVDLVDADVVDAHHVFAINEDGSSGVYAETENDTDDIGAMDAINRGTGAGASGWSYSGAGVVGTGFIGVKGVSSKPGYGASYGVHSNDGPGVVGDGQGENWAGVLGRNPDAEGVRGQGRVGVYGTSATPGQGAIWGFHSGQGFGVVGDGAGANNAGVIGRNGTGDGVRGEGKVAIRGTSSGGYGGVFQGMRAQLRLVPNGGPGRPTTGTHSKGELYLDGAATLWICTVGGTPGTWRKVSTAAN